MGGDLGWREVIGRGVSALTGEYSVEDVRAEDGHLYRRLIFMNNSQLVQSESRLRSAATGVVLLCLNSAMLIEQLEIYFSVWSLLLASAHKKKNKKKSKPSAAEAPALTGVKDRIVDRGFLCCTHHEVMVAGLAMLGMDAINNKGKCASIKKHSESLKRLHSKWMVSFNFLIKDGVCT